MKYKAIITDFDGTLVGSELVVSPKVKVAISTITKERYAFSIASGRLFNGAIQKTCKELHLTAPQITKGGAEIVDPVSGNVIDGEYIPDSIIKEIISYLHSIHAFFFVEKGEITYTITGEPNGISTPVQFKKIDELQMHGIPKIAIKLFDDKNNEEILKKLKDTYPMLNIVATYSPSDKEKYCDLTAASANKHIAALKVVKLLNINPEEVIGIGDSYNDFPLLEACGLKVVMGNAVEDLKAIADYIAPTVDEDGVANVIEKFILNNN